MFVCWSDKTTPLHIIMYPVISSHLAFWRWKGYSSDTDLSPCTIWFTAFSHKCPFTHMCALITRWSSKYTNMCVSLQCGYYIYSSLRGRSIHIDMLSHTNVHAAKTVAVPMSAADHISKQIGGDNAFTPRHTHTLHEARSHLQILQLSGEAELQGARFILSSRLHLHHSRS